MDLHKLRDCVEHVFRLSFAATDPMDDEEEIIKLTPQGKSVRPEGKVRMAGVKKIHLEQLSDSSRKDRTPQLRMVDEQSVETSEEVETMPEEPQRRYFEGRSVEYTIDEILHTNTIDPDVMEKDWGTRKWNFPLGWVILLLCFVLSILGYVAFLLTNMSGQENQNIEVTNAQQEEYATETAAAAALVDTIDTTVKKYLAAATIAEKLRYVRHADAMQPRMESYYATHPLTPIHCRLVTDYSPLTLGGRTFWHVVAPVKGGKGEAILVEQLSDTEVKVDWESHVHYQPMEWDKFAVEKPSAAMAFRVEIETAYNYQAEFTDEARWACFRLQEKSSEKSLFGYVLRGSIAHAAIEERLAGEGKTMILQLLCSKAIKMADAVVIDKVISMNACRIDPPQALTE